MLTHFYTRHISIIFTLLCALNLPTCVFASSIPQQINFQNILENKDILLGECLSLTQDSDGFIWFGGSSGLIRYDGYELRQFDLQVNSDIKNKIPLRYVQALFEDSYHRLWIGSQTGLFLYDSKKEAVVDIGTLGAEFARFSKINAIKIIQAPTGEIIVGAHEGLYIFDFINHKSITILPDSTKLNGLKGGHIAGFAFYNNDLWIGTAVGLEKINWKTKEFTFYSINNEHPDLTIDSQVTDLIYDQHGKFWVGTRHGLVHFDPSTNHHTRYFHDNANQFSLGGNDVWSLLLDSQGTLWIGTDDGGISIYDKSKNRFVNHSHELGRVDSLSSKSVRGMFEDKNGDIWVGTYPEGINFFDRSSAAITSYASNFSNPNSLNHTSILSVAEDKFGNLWLGTDGGGLNYFDREKNKFSHFKSNIDDASSISDDAVLSVHVDSIGTVWAGTWNGGISSFNPGAKKFTRYPFDPERVASASVSTSYKLNSKSVWAIKEDRQHKIWIGTHTGGLSQYNPETKLFTHYTFQENDLRSISSNLVWTLYEDSDGKLWIGTANGLNLKEGELNSFTHFLSDEKNPNAIKGAAVYSIFEDSKKRLWIGTNAGLNLMDRETKKFRAFTKRDGFLSDVIKSITEDSSGLLWVNTENGFSSFDPVSKIIKNYNRIGGRLVGDSKPDTSIVSRRGEIIFVGFKGLRIINPTELSENKVIPPVVLTDFKLLSESVAIGDKDGNLPVAINQSKTITLDYKQLNFTIDFAALNFRESEKNKYRYKLEGFDKNWIDAGTQRAAKYTNIDPGRYVFLVSGSNNDGLWNESGKSIIIIQLPPPWRTWWAFIFYSLIAILVVVVFVYSQRKRQFLMEEQNRFLEKKVMLRTAELREKNNDIQNLLSNMQQGLFAIEEGCVIHQEYSYFLESLFETNDISGRNAMTLLFDKANLGGDVIDRMRTAISTILSADSINYDLNSHLLIREYAASFGDRTKILSLDWNSVKSNDVVVKLMVSVRDVTWLKAVENEARSKERELHIISQLLNVSAKKYLLFSASFKQSIDNNRSKIESTVRPNDLAIALLLRNMHTIKGNCRTYNFDYLSNAVHEVESVYGNLKSDSHNSWNRGRLLGDLLRLESLLGEYDHIFYGILGRGDKSESRDLQGFWADGNAIEIIQSGINAAIKEFPSLRQSQTLLPIQLLLNRALSYPLSEVLSDVLDSLPSIALQLDKEPPRIVIDDHRARIKSSHCGLMMNIFSHILRNSMDHGIEDAKIRLCRGKPIIGTIEINVVPTESRLFIYVKDDGQGLNIDHLFKKGVELGRWKHDDRPSFFDIANLIFVSGLSTRESVSEISGRGIGMDAVKAFLMADGGHISLRLLTTNAYCSRLGESLHSVGALMPFELLIELPESAFILSD